MGSFLSKTAVVTFVTVLVCAELFGVTRLGQVSNAGSTLSVHRNSTVESNPRLQSLVTELSDTLRTAGLPAAMTRLEAIDAVEPVLPQWSHLVVHKLGYDAFKLNPTELAATLAACDERFQYGCYHGVIDAYAEVSPPLSAESINNICGSTKGVVGAAFRIPAQCIHGVGHVLMYQSNHDLFKALPLCELLDTSSGAQRCRIAVFMANYVQMTDQKLIARGLLEPDGHSSHPAAFKPADLQYPCNAVATAYQEDCYIMQPAGIINLLDQDLVRAGKACDGAPEKYQFECYKAYGREMAGYTNWDVSRMHQLCSGIADIGVAACYKGAAMNLTTARRQPLDALPLCALAPSNLQLACYSSIGATAKDFLTDPRSQAAICEKFGAPAYTAACLEGFARGL